MYSFKTFQSKEEKGKIEEEQQKVIEAEEEFVKPIIEVKKAKGVKKTIINNLLTHNDYLHTLMTHMKLSAIRSYKHKLCTITHTQEKNC